MFLCFADRLAQEIRWAEHAAWWASFLSLCFWFWDSPVYRPGTPSVDQAGRELRYPPASAYQMLRLKLCTTTAQRYDGFLMLNSYLFVAESVLTIVWPLWGSRKHVAGVRQLSVSGKGLASCSVCVDSLGFYPVLFMLIFLVLGLWWVVRNFKMCQPPPN